MKNKGSFQLEFALIIAFLIAVAGIAVLTYFPAFGGMTKAMTQEHEQPIYPTYTLNSKGGQE